MLVLKLLDMITASVMYRWAVSLLELGGVKHGLELIRWRRMAELAVCMICPDR